MNEPILEVDNLTFGYASDGPKALDGISFSVNEGSQVAIIGHNGSGKSTLAKAIMGLLGFDYSGTIKLFGQVMDKKSKPSLRSRLGIVFQNPDNQFVGSTVADDIAFGLENKQVPSSEMEAIIEEYAGLAGMQDFLDREPTSLSGGQKQRVAIAGVLAMQPDIVIFDEATAMLDPKGKKEIAGLIEKVRKAKPDLTILSITHDIEEAKLADEVLVLNEGKLILKGSPKEVFASDAVLADSHLDIPFALSLSHELNKLGVKVTPTLDEKELMGEMLCR